MRAQLRCDVIALSTSPSCVRTCVAQEENGFGPRTMLICEQCEREYHIGCLAEYKQVVLTGVPEGAWFCSDSCETISLALDKKMQAGTQTVDMASNRDYTWQVGSRFLSEPLHIELTRQYTRS